MRGRQPSGGAVSVVVENGTIRNVEAVAPLPDDPWITPGLIDLQVNGFGGHDFNGPDVSPEDVAELIDALAKHGTTMAVPTIVTASQEQICHSLQTIAAARQDPTIAHAIPFVHVEGPFLSPTEGSRGVHALDQIRRPDLREFEAWQAACGDLVGIVTISPHWPGSVDFIKAVVAQGVRVSIGHTDATPEEIKAAVDAGATLSTHLGNGAQAQLPRHPNYIWAQLADDRLTAGLIADGHHLPADTLKSMIRAKTPDRVVLVTDSTALAGMPPGDYVQPVGGSVRLDNDGRLSYIGTPYLAGSAATLTHCVAVAASFGGIDLATAVACATVKLSRVIGTPANHVAAIAAGYRADLITFDWEPGQTELSLRQAQASR